MNFFSKLVNLQLWKFPNCYPGIFLPFSLFVSFISFCIKAKILLQFLSQAFIIFYVFPIFFHFHKCLNNFCSSENLLTSRFFHRNMGFFLILLPWCERVVGSLWSKIILYHSKRNLSFLFSLIIAKKLERLFSMQKKVSVHTCAIWNNIETILNRDNN